MGYTRGKMDVIIKENTNVTRNMEKVFTYTQMEADSKGSGAMANKTD